MNMKVWLYIFVLSFSLMAMAGVPSPTFTISKIYPLKVDLLNPFDFSCPSDYEVDDVDFRINRFVGGLDSTNSFHEHEKAMKSSSGKLCWQDLTK